MTVLHTTLLLDQNANDLVLDASGNIALASAPYSVAQDVATQLKTFLGECWYDTTQGLPYWQSLLGESPPASLIASNLEEQAALVPDVVSVSALVGGIDSNRRLIGSVTVTDADSNTITLSL